MERLASILRILAPEDAGQAGVAARRAHARGDGPQQSLLAGCEVLRDAGALAMLDWKAVDEVETACRGLAKRAGIPGRFSWDWHDHGPDPLVGFRAFSSWLAPRGSVCVLPDTMADHYLVGVVAAGPIGKLLELSAEAGVRIEIILPGEPAAPSGMPVYTPHYAQCIIARGWDLGDGPDREAWDIQEGDTVGCAQRLCRLALQRGRLQPLTGIRPEGFAAVARRLLAAHQMFWDWQPTGRRATVEQGLAALAHSFNRVQMDLDLLRIVVIDVAEVGPCLSAIHRDLQGSPVPGLSVRWITPRAVRSRTPVDPLPIVLAERPASAGSDLARQRRQATLGDESLATLTGACADLESYHVKELAKAGRMIGRGRRPYGGLLRGVAMASLSRSEYALLRYTAGDDREALLGLLPAILAPSDLLARMPVPADDDADLDLDDDMNRDNAYDALALVALLGGDGAARRMHRLAVRGDGLSHDRLWDCLAGLEDRQEDCRPECHALALALDAMAIADATAAMAMFEQALSSWCRDRYGKDLPLFPSTGGFWAVPIAALIVRRGLNPASFTHPAFPGDMASWAVQRR